MSLCVNCGIATDHCNIIGSRKLENRIILSIVQEWVAPQKVTEDDIICQDCWDHAINASLDVKSEQTPPKKGHVQVCIQCGRSLLRRVRSHTLNTSTVQERRIHTVIRDWIYPRTVSATTLICHSCWVRASKESRHFHSELSTSSVSSSPVNQSNSEAITHSEEPPSKQECYCAPKESPVGTVIVLPNYFRPVETQSRCFVEGCQRRKERNRITISLRKQLFKTYNFYVPPNNRLCDKHLNCTSWDFLKDSSGKIINTFNAYQIEDMFSLQE